MRFRRVAIIIKSTYIPLHTTGLRVLRKPSSEPGSPESEHRIGTSHDNGIKLELSIQASATHVEERTARMTDLEHIRAKFAAEYGLSEDMLRNAERWTETTGDLEGVPENLLPGFLTTAREVRGRLPCGVVARSTGSGYSASSTLRRNTRFHTRIRAISVSSETNTDTPTSR